MLQVVEIFKELALVPHCSGATEAMKDHLLSEAEALGYESEVDAAGNILCRKAGSKLTLQAHYDMVCIGTAPEITIIENEGWLSAKGSTLGADNGIAMAMMLCLMREGAPVDALFTNDEEIGLLGARSLDVSIATRYLLNIDSEEEGVVTIGCAGGEDIIAELDVNTTDAEGECFECVVEGLPGGHSGIDIDKNIPNAIKELAAILQPLDAPLVSFEGGERRNAIAKRATARILCDTLPEGMEARSLGVQRVKVVNEGARLISMLHAFAHGVRGYDAKLGIVRDSINLAQVEYEAGKMRIHLSARSMSEAGLRRLSSECRTYFEAFGAKVRTEGYYPPWQPEATPFAVRVQEAVAQVSGKGALGAIHAGLECGIIKERYKGLEIASIGPNIVAPHSTLERVEIASVTNVYKTVHVLIASL